MARGEIVVSDAANAHWRGFPGYWSDRRIAEACQVGGTLVLNVRRESQVLSKSTSAPTTRTGKDGKQYPAKRESRGWTAPEVAQ